MSIGQPDIGYINNQEQKDLDKDRFKEVFEYIKEERDRVVTFRDLSIPNRIAMIISWCVGIFYFVFVVAYVIFYITA